MLVCDEVQSGFARTGKFFAIEHFGVEPDLITVAKSIAMGLPLSGVLGKAAIMDAPGAGGVGGTYVGNPVAQAAALAVLDVIEDEGLVARSAAIGETMRSRMESWQQRWPQVGDVRGLGAMLAIELVAGDKEPATELASRVVDEALQRGLLLLKAGVAGQLHPRAGAARDLGRGARRSAPRLGRRARSGCFRPGSGTLNCRWSARCCQAATSSRSSSGPEECRASTGRTTGCSPARWRSRCCTSTTARTRLTSSGSAARRAPSPALSHPNIVAVIDRGEHEGRQFIVFEYVEGENLKRLIEREGPLPVERRSSSRSRSRAASRSRTGRGSCTGTSSRRTCC